MYLIVRVWARCQTCVTDRTSYELNKFKECGDLLCSKGLPLTLKITVDKSYVGKQCCMEVKHGAWKKVKW